MLQVVDRNVQEPPVSQKNRNTKCQHDDSQQSPSRDDAPSSYQIPGNDPPIPKEHIFSHGKFFVT